MLDFLPGKKTYLVGAFSILWGLLSAFMPEAMTQVPVADDPMQAILIGLTALGLRKGMSG